MLGRQDAGVSGRDKTSLIMSAHNRTGALAGLLAPFSGAGVSMTRLESRPRAIRCGSTCFSSISKGIRTIPVAKALELGELNARALPEGARVLSRRRLLNSPWFARFGEG